MHKNYQIARESSTTLSAQTYASHFTAKKFRTDAASMEK